MSTPATNPDDQPIAGQPLVLANPMLEQSGPRGPRALADLYQLPVIDLRAERVQTDAAESIPLHVLTRIRALPLPGMNTARTDASRSTA